MRRPRRRFAFAAVLPIVAAVGLFAAKTVDAGVVSSPHDFSSSGPFTRSVTIAPSGVCSACHIAHGADVPFIWSRSLSSYRSLLDVDGTGTYNINYVHAPTLQCYDCHDTHTMGNIDDIPVKNDFGINHRPQDIAFGGDGPHGVAGFYENNPPDNTNLRGANPNLNPNDSAQLARTGGHYFKHLDPDGASSAFRKGDKLSCRDCHDPHEYSSTKQVFIRGDLPNAGDVSLSFIYGSTDMANQSTGSHDNAVSRRICVSCHSYSDTQGTSPVRYNQISTAYTETSAIPKPPDTVAEHRSDAGVQNVACVLCHKHNYIDANCTGCHGFPPNPYPPSRNPAPTFGAYTARDPHAMHTGRTDGQPPNSFSIYGFECKTCHATSALGTRTVSGIHNNSGYNVAYDLSALGVSNPPDAISVGRLACANVYCHSNGGSDNTMAGNGNYYRTVTWGVTPAPLSCDGCHGTGTTPATPQFGMPNYATGAAGSPTANSHAKHVAGYECSVCHFNTATGNWQTGRTIRATPLQHVNGSREVVFDGTTATAGPGGYHLDNAVPANNKRCDVSCHGVGKPLADQPQWGGTASCLDCHSGTEPVYKPQDNVGVANPVDSNEYFYSGHGRSGSNYIGSGNLPARFDNVNGAPSDCYYCHSQNAPHSPPDRTNDPFRLGYGMGPMGQKGTLQGMFADNTDLLCLGCHGTAAQRGSNPNAAQGTTTVDAQTHARGITGVKYNWPGSNYPWKCVDCHDPHGDGKSGAERYMMIRSGINAPIDNVDANAGSDAKSRTKRTDANVRSVAFNSLVGYSTSGTVYSYANQGNGPPWGPCEVCHTQVTAYSRTKDNLASHATRTNRCSTCHPHKSGFAPTACRGCHGPDSVATAARAPDVGLYWSSSGHGRFQTGTPLRAIECEDCHDASYLTASTHKTDGSVAGDPPNNLNTLNWPGKTSGADFDPNANTAHLKAGYINTSPSTRADVARTFDAYCNVTCHRLVDARFHHWKDTGPLPRDVMRFGDQGTTSNPKQYNWMTVGTYATGFYRSQSPWIDSDIRVSGLPGDTTNYAICVSCHDPHGTGVTDTSGYPGLGITNHMIRGGFVTDMGTFCSGACHRTP